MTSSEYIQLTAFARNDGFLLSLLWVASFASYILGITNQILALLAVVLAVMTPFFVFSRLRRYRDWGRNGLISFRRGYAYAVFVFFYGGVLFAVVQYLYFAYVDNGYLLNTFSKIISSEEGQQLLQQYGMTQMADESLSQMAMTRPIDYALNILTVNIVLGFILGIPIGLLGQRRVEVKE